MSNMLGEFIPDEYTSHSNTEFIEIMENAQCTEGFSFLEQGIYFRDVSDIAFQGQLMLILDPARIIVGTANSPGRQPSNVQSMVASYDAIAGINGGWYSGFSPVGFVIAGGQRVYPPTPHYDSNTIVGFTNDNILIMGQFTEAEALEAGIRDSLHTYPILIINGEPQITSGDGGWGIAPRTAIAQRQDGAVLFLTIDGRQFYSFGATQRQVQDILLENNAYNAIALDGGSSSAMYYRGEYLNNPSLGREGSVPTSFLVLYQ
jgi:exopolysaccharide biosynthesis protein